MLLCVIFASCPPCAEGGLVGNTQGEPALLGPLKAPKPPCSAMLVSVFIVPLSMGHSLEITLVSIGFVGVGLSESDVRGDVGKMGGNVA
jgi:hypothetical protein